MQPVERLGHDRDRCVEADAELGDGQVVVDRFRHSDRREPRLVERRADAQRVVAADRDKGVDAVVAKRADRRVDAVLLLEWVGARGAENRAAHGQDAPDVLRRHLADEPRLEAARPPVLDAADLVAKLKPAARHGADGGVEPRRVTAARQDPDSHEPIG